MFRVASLIGLLAVACQSSPPRTTPEPAAERPWRALSASFARSVEWRDDAPLVPEVGLTSGDAPDTAIDRLLAHRVTLPARLNIGVLHLPGSRARLSWYSSGQGSELTQTLADSLLGALGRSPRVGRAVIVPALVVGGQQPMPTLREAAARVQAHVLLVYRPTCHLFDRVPFIGATQYRAVCSVDAILLDTRSGVIPFSSVVTVGETSTRMRGDFDQGGTFRRIQMLATTKGLMDVSQRVVSFLASVPEGP